MNAADPFDTGVERDRYGRALIKPPGGGPLEPYTRASTFAKALDDAGGLITWKTRHVAVGVGRKRELAAMLAGLDPEPKSKPDRENLDALVEQAHDASDGNAKANYGTAVHTFTEPDNPFDNYVPDYMRADVEAYQAEIERWGIEVVETEAFVVEDTFRIAGTRDHTYRIPEDMAGWWSARSGMHDATVRDVVADKKTGKFHPLSVAIQLAIYAHGQLYDDSTGERTACPVRLDYGIGAHIPKGKGTATLIRVDLRVGWELGVKLAEQVRAWRERKDVAEDFADGWLAPYRSAHDVIADKVRAATTGDELADIWEAHSNDWTDDLTALVITQKQSIDRKEAA